MSPAHRARSVVDRAIDVVGAIADWVFVDRPGEPRLVSRARSVAAALALVAGMVVAAPVVIVKRWVCGEWRR